MPWRVKEVTCIMAQILQATPCDKSRGWVSTDGASCLQVQQEPSWSRPRKLLLRAWVTGEVTRTRRSPREVPTFPRAPCLTENPSRVCPVRGIRVGGKNGFYGEARSPWARMAMDKCTWFESYKRKRPQSNQASFFRLITLESTFILQGFFRVCLGRLTRQAPSAAGSAKHARPRDSEAKTRKRYDHIAIWTYRDMVISLYDHIVRWSYLHMII